MINCNGRFTDCDDSLYPSVNVYDYTGNISTRSSDNRTFRWEDVYKTPIYLYDEATISGDFELNSYIGLHPVTNPTGINYITTGTTSRDSASYPGWIVSGRFTFYVGPSGVHVTSGSLTGFNQTVDIYPLQGTEAIALYSYQNKPIVYSAITTTGEGGVIIDGTHQVYAQAKTFYSPNHTSGEYLHVYPRGWNSNTVVAYYNYHTATWGLSAPTTGIFISTSGYTEIKYNFIATDFPAATPTGFDLFVQPQSTGGLFVVDDLHIDAVLKKNAFVDSIIPSGYIIELTPDIGWHNQFDMFTYNGESTNPFLRTLGPFSESAGNLVDNLDNTVSVIVDETQFLEAINSRYPNYLWRAIALDNDGSYGEGGIPQRFTYIGDQINERFSVTNVSNSPDSSTKTINGTKSKRASILVNDLTDIAGLEYPTPETWKLVYILTSPKEVIKIQAMDAGGATSSYKYIELSCVVFDQQERPLWNVFDEHGLLLDVDRLPNESNKEFQDRLQAVTTSVGGSNFEGIVNAGTRELGLDKILDAISVSIRKDSNGIPLTSNLTIDVESTSIRVRTASMVIEETLLVDPVYRTVTLNKSPNEFPSYCEIVGGIPIDINKISWDKNNDNVGTEIRLYIDDSRAWGKYVTIKYEYYETLSYTVYPSLGALVEGLNSLVDNSGTAFVLGVLSPRMSGNELSLGLYNELFSIDATITAQLSWSPMYLKRVSDHAYREYNRDQISYRRSKFYKYVSQLKANSRILWGAVEADRDYWDAADRSDLSLDVVPTLMDPDISEFYSSISGLPIKLDSVQAWGRLYLGFSGEQLNNTSINNYYFQPGVGFSNDLLPGIHYINSYKFNASEEYYNISEEKNDNNVVIFSGQA